MSKQQFPALLRCNICKIVIPIMVILIIVPARQLFAQDYYMDMRNARARQERELIAYNVGLGIVSTTIGALINKPKKQKAWDCIKNSIWQGALGGGLQYAGKKLTYQITKDENEWWGWPSKLVHSAGVSICQNGAMGYGFGKYWVLDYGPARFNFTIQKGSLDFQPQLNLLFAYDMYQGLKWGYVDWPMSLRTGAFTFVSPHSTMDLSDGRKALGMAYTRSIIYTKDNQWRKYETIAHELVHTYQANEYRVSNTYFIPLMSKIHNKAINNFFKYVYIEFPASYIIHGIAIDKNHHYKSFFEYEAKFFSTNEYVDRSEGF